MDAPLNWLRGHRPRYMNCVRTVPGERHSGWHLTVKRCNSLKGIWSAPQAITALAPPAPATWRLRAGIESARLTPESGLKRHRETGRWIKYASTPKLLPHSTKRPRAGNTALADTRLNIR